MKSENLIKKTTNRKVFNRLYKSKLESTNKIRCTYCRYHKGENDKGKWYGGHWDDKIDDYGIRYPSWKLVSKNSKQWLKKPIKIAYRNLRYGNNYYINIEW